MHERFLSWLRSVLQEGTPDSMARVIFFLVGVVTCLTFLAGMIYSLWTHSHTPEHVYDLPRNLSDSMRDVFIAAGAGKIVQRIWGESGGPPTPPAILP
jgi:hypothetical protein